jgi:crotonobetainyl-CoA:carnitine CoA-transferase CaiB-like acyl-CoA transferase
MILRGVRVLDVGRYIAGPYCAALLGDLGADVIRIERVGGGEDRTIPALTPTGEGGMYLQMNRNKRGMTLDLASNEGRGIAKQLVKSADVVVANLPSATLAQLGLDYETLAGINPRIILALGTAYGPGGPRSAQVGFDSVGQAMSGAMYISGEPGRPARALVNYVDIGTAQALAMGVLGALLMREKTGTGQMVEASLLQTAMVHSNSWLIEQALTSRNRQPQGNRGATAAPVDAFQASDGWVFVQVVGQPIFARWCRLVGREDMLSDARYASDELRGDHGEAISAIMAAWCASRTRAQVLDALDAAKIPCAPVHSLRDALEDTHIQQAGMLQPMPFPGTDKPVPLACHPVRYSATTLDAPRRAPLLGEHTDDVLRELGIGSDRIDQLRATGVI